jgi:hypothetical protein
MKKNYESFIGQCRLNYFDKISPSNEKSINSEGYLKLVEIAKSYFENDDEDAFYGYFQDGQYFIQLWVAHLVIKYGNPSSFWKNQALDIIRDYSDNPLAPEVAAEERRWLDENYPS